MSKFTFTPFLSQAISQRKGEVRMGEKIKAFDSIQEAEFVILGISEDFGPQFNNLCLEGS